MASNWRFKLELGTTSLELGATSLDPEDRFPREWTDMEDPENLLVGEVQPGTQEYFNVIGRFLKEAPQNKVVKLERIQNKLLYKQYFAKKNFLDSHNPRGTCNERDLWHGTASDVVRSINANGFNSRFCGRNATAYGEGVYFAVSAGYSANDTYSKPDANGYKKMYLCKVLTGVYTQGEKGMRVAPPRDKQKRHIQYDSVVDNLKNPNMFIIFSDTQAYPCYIITFQ